MSLRTVAQSPRAKGIAGMALLTTFRAALARGLSVAQRTKRKLRLALESLEGREVPAVGGGFVDGGIQGDYFDNPNLAGSPAFSRRDVRIDFDWQGNAPGGCRGHVP